MIRHRMFYDRKTRDWLKSQGFVDLGATYRLIGGFSTYPKHKPWDEEPDDED